MLKKVLIFVLTVLALNCFATVNNKLGGGRGRLVPPQLYYSARADSAHGFDVLNYTINLSIDDANQYIEGSVTALVQASQNLSQINYELEGLAVTQVQVNGQQAQYQHNNGVISITLPNVVSGQQFTTTVNYQGNPQLTTGAYQLGMFFNNNGVLTVSDPNAARYWWPCYDHPWDKAEVDINVTMRSDWKVAANGIRTSITDNQNNTKTHHWDGHSPMATYLVCITAGPFVELTGNYNSLPLHNFVPASIQTQAENDLALLPDMVAAFEDFYGPYPFEKYGNAVTSMMTYGAMEHQTMTTLGATFIDGQAGGAVTIAHELAHQWYGDCVTPLTWADVWLSEGFATYSEYIWMTDWQGQEAADNYLQSQIYNYYRSWANSNGWRAVYNPPYDETFAPPVYEKAAMVLHMLRAKIGEDNFRQLMRSWFNNYYNGNVVTGEFIDLAQQISGQDLQQFFNQWIYGQGIPTADWAMVTDPATDNSYIYAQTQSPTTTQFYLDLNFMIDYSGNQTEYTAVASPTGQYTMLEPSLGITGVQHTTGNKQFTRSVNRIQPELTQALAGANGACLFWNPFTAWQTSGCRFYKSASQSGPWQEVNSGQLYQNGDLVLDTGLTPGQTWYYLVAAVLPDGKELRSAPVSATTVAFNPDYDLLLVDESADGNGTLLQPTDLQSDTFYHNVIGVDYTDWDVGQNGLPVIDNLRRYRAVLWHDDDLGATLLNQAWPDLVQYVLSGGQLYVGGWRTFTVIDQSWFTSLLGADSLTYVNTADFAGMQGQGYPGIDVNPDAVVAAWGGNLPYICSFSSADNPAGLFVQPQQQGQHMQPCMVKNYQLTGKLIMAGFPLYYMQAGQVQQFLQQVLVNDFDLQVESQDATAPAAALQVKLLGNPTANPGVRVRSNNSLVTVGVYNLKGQLVASQALPQKQSNWHWNGLDINGKTCPSGVYLFKVKAGKQAVIKKALLLK